MARIIVYPGFMRSGIHTRQMREWLTGDGHEVHDWPLQTNRGLDELTRFLIVSQLKELSQDGPLTLIGWSLGGFYVKWLAREYPECVDQTISIATPTNPHVASIVIPLDVFVMLERPTQIPHTNICGIRDKHFPMHHCYSFGDSDAVNEDHFSIIRSPDTLNCIRVALKHDPRP